MFKSSVWPYLKLENRLTKCQNRTIAERTFDVEWEHLHTKYIFVVSTSIEFDRDSEFFAIAGVTKKIKVFEYSVVRDAVVDLHYPIQEMTCASKIRCEIFFIFFSFLFA